MDVFKYADYVDRNGRPQEGNSVMQELFEAFTVRALTKQRRVELADIIYTLC